MLKSIGLLSCYFGKLPWYFRYFVHSCKFNPTVDFIIFSDDLDFEIELSQNIKLIYITLQEFNKLASNKMKLPINISYGYKLCDFKPAYGVIFSEYLKNYYYWGHCDIDIIYGDIRGFITNDLLENHDLISVRLDWITGCFLLYKNITKMNTLFTNSKDYKMVFCSDLYQCFDETGFMHDEFSAGKYYKDVFSKIESMMHVVKKYEELGFIKPFFNQYIVEGLPGKLRWELGKMYYKNYEILFYHLIYFKGTFFPKYQPKAIPGYFNISPTKIYSTIKNQS